MPFDNNQPIWIHPAAAHIGQSPAGTYEFDLSVTVNQWTQRSDGTPITTLPLPQTVSLKLSPAGISASPIGGTGFTPLQQVVVTAADYPPPPGPPHNATRVIHVVLQGLTPGDYTLRAECGIYSQERQITLV